MGAAHQGAVARPGGHGDALLERGQSGHGGGQGAAEREGDGGAEHG